MVAMEANRILQASWHERKDPVGKRSKYLRKVSIACLRCVAI